MLFRSDPSIFLSHRDEVADTMRRTQTLWGILRNLLSPGKKQKAGNETRVADDIQEVPMDSREGSSAIERGVQAVHCTGAHNQKRGP